MIVPNISTEDLEKLPLRAIVALAARCARRVESLSLLPDGHPDRIGAGRPSTVPSAWRRTSRGAHRVGPCHP